MLSLFQNAPPKKKSTIQKIQNDPIQDPNPNDDDLFDQEDERVREWRREQGVKPELAERGLSFEPLKHYFKIYARDFEGAAELRARLMECHSTAEAREVLA